MITNECWLWIGAKNGREGYGYIGFKRHIVPAHRIAWMMKYGDIPDNMELDHICREHTCVNPEHLDLVTHRENLLRGNTVCAANAKVLYCPQGHPYDDVNTYWRPDGHGRGCRLCRERRNKERIKTPP